MFCHTERLRNSPLRLKLVLSDSAAERGEFEELKGFNNCQIYWWHDLLSLSETGIKFMNRYVGVLIILGTITGAFMSAGALAPAIDLMSLVVVIAVGVGHAFGVKDGENRITRFGDGCVRGGWLGLLIGIIIILNVDAAAQMDFTMIIPAMAVAWLTPLYGYFFKLISMQLD